MPVAAAIPAIVGGVTSVVGGLQGRSAAKNAAAAQQAAAGRAGQTFTTAGERAITGVNEGVTNANQALETAYTRGTEALSPYQQAGAEALTSLRSLLAPGGDLSRTFTAADMKAYDPGYQFRLDEGNKAVQRSAAAGGGALGGATLKALTRYAQGAASSEYANAFDRFMRGQQQRYTMLSGLAGSGQNAATNLADLAASTGARTSGNIMGGAQLAGGFGMDAARGLAEAQMGAGNAQAAGHVGSANAWNGMLSGLAGSAQMLGQDMGWTQPRVAQPMQYALPTLGQAAPMPMVLPAAPALTAGAAAPASSPLAYSPTMPYDPRYWTSAAGGMY